MDKILKTIPNDGEDAEELEIIRDQWKYKTSGTTTLDNIFAVF